jgi:hypothetical protein
MKKYETSFDILHYLWQELESDAKKDVQYPLEMTMGDWINVKLDKITAKDFVKEAGKDKFYFELTYCLIEPDRSTVKWINGEHVFLYDQYLCEKHGILIMTSDDYLGYIVGQTVFCPECNKHILKPNKIFPFEYQKIEDQKMIKAFAKLGRQNRLRIKIDNFFYRIKRTFQKFSYSIQKSIGVK